MWLSNTGCEEVVQAAWTSVGDFGSEEAILAKVEKCGKGLSWWNKKIFGNVKRELDRLKKNLAKAEIEAMTSGNNFRIRQIKREIKVFLEKGAIMWAQRSRVLWARQGDQNTKYFHSCATRRYRKNVIEGIRDANDRWRDQPIDISTVLVNYYKNLFTSTKHIMPQNVLSCVPPIIDDKMNAALSQEFNAKEVEDASDQMAPLKAPGLDEMPPLFYLHFLRHNKAGCHYLHFGMAEFRYLTYPSKSSFYQYHT